MAYSYRTIFSSIGRAIDGFTNSVSVAHDVDQAFRTPETVFRARGTTRDAVVRATVARL